MGERVTRIVILKNIKLNFLKVHLFHFNLIFFVLLELIFDFLLLLFFRRYYFHFEVPLILHFLRRYLLCSLQIGLLVFESPLLIEGWRQVLHRLDGGEYLCELFALSHPSADLLAINPGRGQVPQMRVDLTLAGLLAIS